MISAMLDDGAGTASGAVLYQGIVAAGTPLRLTWQPITDPAGVYRVRVSTDAQVWIRKMVLRH